MKDKRRSVVNSKNKRRKKKKGKEDQVYKIFGLVLLAIICISFVVFVIKNSDGSHIFKTEYTVGEMGYLDKIEVTLKKINYIHNQSAIDITFEITNRTDNTITITPDEYFKFYDINEVQIPNKFTTNPKIVKSDETILYKLEYDVTKKELYEVYFYSQVVENNIKFSFKTSDIQPEVVQENNISQEDKLDD